MQGMLKVLQGVMSECSHFLVLSSHSWRGYCLRGEGSCWCLSYA
jgi:hypothetical protein